MSHTVTADGDGLANLYVLYVVEKVDNYVRVVSEWTSYYFKDF